MIPEASNFVTFLLEGVMSVMLIVLLFYALRILTSFKKGMLERGWKLLSQGIVILVVGELIISLSNYQSAGGYLFQLGIGVDAIGVGLAVFGFKSHHDIWRMGKEYRDKDSAPTAEAKSV